MPSLQFPVPITPDKGIMKLLLDPGDPCLPFPQYDKAALAVFHYRIHTIPFKDDKDPNDIFKSGQALATLSDEIDVDETEVCEHGHPRSIDPRKRIKIGDSILWDKRPFELRLGKGFSVTAFELAIKTMRIGERSKFFCLPQYAEPYIQLEAILRGERDKKHSAMGCCAANYDFEKNQDLFQLYGCSIQMELHLIRVDETLKKKEIWEISIEERINLSEKCKNKGDELFKLKKYGAAADEYGKSIGYLQSSLNQVRQEEINCDQDFEGRIEIIKSNFCACKLQLKEYKEVIVHASAILDKNPSHIKARYRRAKAYLYNQDFEEAKNDFEKLRSITDDQVLIDQIDCDLRLIERQISETRAKVSEMYKNIFK